VHLVAVRASEVETQYGIAAELVRLEPYGARTDPGERLGAALRQFVLSDD